MSNSSTPEHKSIGQVLLHARELKGVTSSQAAAATRIKIQHIDCMEADDFSPIAAAIYARGFLKLYAEYLGIDPEPLIEQYDQQHAPRKQPSLDMDEETEPSTSVQDVDLWKELKHWAQILKLSKTGPALIGVILLIMVVGQLSTCGSKNTERSQTQSITERETAVIKPESRQVILPPPAPYLN